MVTHMRCRPIGITRLGKPGNNGADAITSAIHLLDPSAATAAAAAAIPAATIILYTYSNSDPEYERNLNFFVEHGMWEGDGCQYLIIVQQV